jgi:hypothetical protein
VDVFDGNGEGMSVGVFDDLPLSGEAAGLGIDESFDGAVVIHAYHRRYRSS